MNVRISFVILHGTDTMAYTASALSFMLENLAKPVILTGAQVPLGEIYNDAKRNLCISMYALFVVVGGPSWFAELVLVVVGVALWLAKFVLGLQLGDVPTQHENTLFLLRTTHCSGMRLRGSAQLGSGLLLFILPSARRSLHFLMI